MYEYKHVMKQAKDPFDVPGRPDAPNVDEIVAESANLSWSPPKDNGGAPITNYVLEYKARGDMKWQMCKDKVKQFSLMLISDVKLYC